MTSSPRGAGFYFVVIEKDKLKKLAVNISLNAEESGSEGDCKM